MSVKRPDPTDLEVGRTIRMHRLNKGHSQTVLANAVGVTFQQIQKYERGVNRVSMGRLHKIAETLGVPTTAFIPTADAGADTPSEATDLSKFVRDMRTMRLLKAFNRIRDRDVRESIAAMVEATANSLEGENRAAAA